MIAHAWYAGEYALGEYTFPSRVVDQMIADEERGLAAAIRDAKSLGATRVTSNLMIGYPWQQIVETLRHSKTCRTDNPEGSAAECVR